MVYKKYVKKRGKTFGPYYYESYRDDTGKVKRRYLGTTDPTKKETKKGKKGYGSSTRKIIDKTKKKLIGFTTRKKKVVHTAKTSIGFNKLSNGFNKLSNGFNKTSIDSKKSSKGFNKFTKGFNKTSIDSKKPSNSRKILTVGFLLMFVFISFFSLGIFFDSNFSGLAVANLSSVDNSIDLELAPEEILALQNDLYEDETVDEKFDNLNTSLEIRNPGRVGNSISKNKNKRMDFELSEGRMRLYFQMLNSSEFRKGLAKKFAVDVLNDGDGVVVSEENLVGDGGDVLAIDSNNQTVENIISVDDKLNQTLEENDTGMGEVVGEETLEGEETGVNVEGDGGEVGEGVEGDVEQDGGEVGEEVVDNVSSEEVSSESTSDNTDVSQEDISPFDVEGSEVSEGNEDSSDVETPGQSFSITGNIIRAVMSPLNFIGSITGYVVDNSTTENENTSEASLASTSANVSTPQENLAPEGVRPSEDEGKSEGNETNSSVVKVVVRDDEIDSVVEGLNEDEIEEIEDEARFDAEDFDIVVDDYKGVSSDSTSANTGVFEDNLQSEGNEVYKWGYELRLKDLEFMSSIEITSDVLIKIYDEHSVQIGRNIVSFEDLVSEGYTVRIEKPEIIIREDVVVDVEAGFEEAPQGVPSEEGMEEIVVEDSVEEEGVEEIEVGEDEIEEENASSTSTSTNASAPEEDLQSGGNESVELDDVNVSEGNTTVDLTGDAGDISSSENIDSSFENTSEVEENVEQDGEAPLGVPQSTELGSNVGGDINLEGEGDGGEEEDASLESTDSDASSESSSEVKDSETSEGSEESNDLETPEQGFSITGNLIRSLRGWGRVTGLVVRNENLTEVKDIGYSYSVTLYIERDFRNNSEGIKVGDLIVLDPKLIIIPLSDAEELDVNKSYIRNVYNETRELDNLTVSINDSHYVRASFNSSLDNTKDITIYAGVVDSCSLSGVSSVVVNEMNVSCEIYLKKKRIDEIRGLLDG